MVLLADSIALYAVFNDLTVRSWSPRLVVAISGAH